METIEFTPAIQRALAEAVTSLNRGDKKDRKVADSVEEEIAQALNLTLEFGKWVPFKEASRGFVVLHGHTTYAYIDAEGQWVGGTGPLPKGTRVFRTEDLKYPMCLTK